MNKKGCLSTAKELTGFLGKSPTCSHAVQSITDCLEEAGFIQLHEGEKWELIEDGSYYVTRSGSSVIPFKMPGEAFSGSQIMASHSDSPFFKVKEDPETETKSHYVRLNIEKYGDMLCASWFDRSLSAAGHLAVKEGNHIAIKLVRVDCDPLMIPNLAVHFNREVNGGYQHNAQADMPPSYGDADAREALMEIVVESAGVKKGDILGHDLYLHNRASESTWGAGGELLSHGHLDGLQCASSTLRGFLEGSYPGCVNVHMIFDNEEIDSLTEQGTDSAFLKNVLRWINSIMGKSEEEYPVVIASSFMVSTDSVHAVHPNHGDESDPVNRPYMNEGIAIKYNIKYATDRFSAIVFRALCQEEGVSYQTFTNRSGKTGGSILGNISNSHVAVSTIDVGLLQLSMYSSHETVGIKDTCYLIRAIRRSYSTSMKVMNPGSCEVR